MELEAARKLHDDLLAAKPEGARHDSDICQFCLAAVTDSATSSGNPPAPSRSDVPTNQPPRTTEGGTTSPMTDITQEAHEALLAKAVRDAVATTEAALAAKVTEMAELTTKLETLTADKSKVDEEVKRLNTELDSAQVAKKTAEDKAEQLTKDLAAKDEAAAKAETASKRTAQVTNLKLFPDEYVTEKASLWAEMSEEDWAARLEEWQKLKPATAAGEGETKVEAASAMTGTTGSLTATPEGEAKKPAARRAALGLVN